MSESVESRAEEAEEELDEAEQELEEAEEEYEESEDDDDEREVPDLRDVEAKVRRATEKLGKVDLAGLGDAISAAVGRVAAVAGHAAHGPHPAFDVERMRQELGGRSNTVMTRISDEDLAILDTLVEAGLASSRSECAAMFVHEGIIARRDLISRVRLKADQIRRLKESMRAELKGIGGAGSAEDRRAAPPASPARPAPPGPPPPPAPPSPPAAPAGHPTEAW